MNLEWNEPKLILNAKNGKSYCMRKASITDEFWDIYNLNKGTIKNTLSLSKFKNFWSVNQWIELTEEQLQMNQEELKQNLLKEMENDIIELTKKLVFPEDKKNIG